MSPEDSHSGIPTRAIHEAYLNMQMSLKEYRQAKDGIGAKSQDKAHGELQQDVLTFFELLKPHIRKEPSLQVWWEGELPNYNGDGSPPDPEDGKGIIHYQVKSDPVELDELETTQIEGLQDWHEGLNLNGNRRIIGVAGMGDTALIRYHQYQKGLKHLDSWETK
jgi:hypothetical protein